MIWGSLHKNHSINMKYSVSLVFWGNLNAVCILLLDQAPVSGGT